MIQISDLQQYEGQEVTIKGWLTNARSGKGILFLILRDGSGYVQCIANQENLGEEQFEIAKSLTQESSVAISGMVVKDEKQIGGFELQVTKIEVLHIANEYPITNKAHGIEFLADKRHLWLRSKRQWAIMRVRNYITYAIHNFFQKEGFVQMDAPIFTGNAVEGTTTLFETEFYNRPAYLSQSGQLYGEAMAMAMGKIYTFGPTFRAEKSKTRRHLSEFWMIEPEMAFYSNEDNMNLIEIFLKSVVSEVLGKAKEELAILERDTSFLETLIDNDFVRLTYDQAAAILVGDEKVDGKTTIEVLENDLKETNDKVTATESEIAEKEATIAAGGIKKGKRNFLQNRIDQQKAELKDLEESQRNIPQWIESAKTFKYGSDLGGSDETVLTRMFSSPIMVYNWPHQIKAFYMKRTEDGKFAKGVDVLAPEGYGEIVGGGERETNEDLLVEKIKEHELPMEAFSWYLDLRRYGSVPHSGFGLGLERMVAWICKLPHIRETIPFPRMYGRLMP